MSIFWTSLGLTLESRIEVTPAI